MIYQRTLNKEFVFEGKGLHSGKYSKMIIKPAPADTGVLFHRVDLGDNAKVGALVSNVSNTARSTTISKDGVSVMTIEHLLSALYGMGIDNAIVEIDNVEVPILDGSASFYVKAFKGNIVEHDRKRNYITLTETLEVKDEDSGSWIKAEPADEQSFDITVDFNSKILGIQKSHWDMSTDYASEIGVCRTFVFFHELENLFNNNLIKGGDIDNAIVIVENPVSRESLDRVTTLLDKPFVSVNKSGYLDHITLHHPDECGRHKMLDIIGDLALVGSYVKAKFTAFKPGHKINTMMARKIFDIKQ